jgi:hypothetical protein
LQGQEQASVVVRLQGVADLIRTYLTFALTPLPQTWRIVAMNPRLTFHRLSWKWSLPGPILVALLAAFFNPPDPGVTSGEFEYVQRVVDGDT